MFLDRRFPVELNPLALTEFDNDGYIQSLASFFIKGAFAPAFENPSVEEIREKIAGDPSVLPPVNLDLPIDQALSQLGGLNNQKIKSLSPSQKIGKLYYLGCPPLYYFHKTAVTTHQAGNTLTFQANPLSQKEVNVATNYDWTRHYFRPGDEARFLVAFPVLEVLEAIEELPEEIKEHAFDPMAAGINLQTIPFSSLSPDRIAAILEKTRTFTLEKEKPLSVG